MTESLVDMGIYSPHEVTILIMVDSILDMLPDIFC